MGWSSDGPGLPDTSFAAFDLVQDVALQAFNQFHYGKSLSSSLDTANLAFYYSPFPLFTTRT
jgi:hypothetical protein